MTDQKFHQLRFDICENVRLHTQQPSMKELIELDLYPDVEIKDKGNHLKIEGFLRLKGVYQSGEETENDQYEGERSEELSYIIPVEITLPADRAELSHISAEIESFDYQVLSPFELQIDAILLIDGLIPEKQGEEVTVEQDRPMFSGSKATIETKNETEEEENLQKEDDDVTPDQKESMETDDTDTPERDDSDTPKRIEAYPENIQSDEPVAEQLEELKQEEQPLETEEEVEQNQDIREEQLGEESDKTNDDWSRWLLRENEENFTPMRLVIVQENDSVQSIAERYEISPNQIRQVNRLDDRELEKGQTIYIPNPNKNEKETSS